MELHLVYTLDLLTMSKKKKSFKEESPQPSKKRKSLSLQSEGKKERRSPSEAVQDDSKKWISGRREVRVEVEEKENSESGSDGEWQESCAGGNISIRKRKSKGSESNRKHEKSVAGDRSSNKRMSGNLQEKRTTRQSSTLQEQLDEEEELQRVMALSLKEAELEKFREEKKKICQSDVEEVFDDDFECVYEAKYDNQPSSKSYKSVHSDVDSTLYQEWPLHISTSKELNKTKSLERSNPKHTFIHNMEKYGSDHGTSSSKLLEDLGKYEVCNDDDDEALNQVLEENKASLPIELKRCQRDERDDVQHTRTMSDEMSGAISSSIGDMSRTKSGTISDILHNNASDKAKKNDIFLMDLYYRQPEMLHQSISQGVDVPPLLVDWKNRAEETVDIIQGGKEALKSRNDEYPDTKYKQIKPYSTVLSTGSISLEAANVEFCSTVQTNKNINIEITRSNNRTSYWSEEETLTRPSCDVDAINAIDLTGEAMEE